MSIKTQRLNALKKQYPLSVTIESGDKDYNGTHNTVNDIYAYAMRLEREIETLKNEIDMKDKYRLIYETESGSVSVEFFENGFASEIRDNLKKFLTACGWSESSIASIINL